MGITQENLKEHFYYEDGFLFRRKQRAKYKVGSSVGTPTPLGYRKARFNGKSYQLHRMIYLYHHGTLPEFIDHIDNNRSNNLIENLRPATKQENCRNVKKRANCSSQYKGVSFDKNCNKWTAKIRINTKLNNIGTYKTEYEAFLAYTEIAKREFGDFYREK